MAQSKHSARTSPWRRYSRRSLLPWHWPAAWSLLSMLHWHFIRLCPFAFCEVARVRFIRPRARCASLLSFGCAHSRDPLAQFLRLCAYLSLADGLQLHHAQPGQELPGPGEGCVTSPPDSHRVGNHRMLTSRLRATIVLTVGLSRQITSRALTKPSTNRLRRRFSALSFSIS